ncbi:hypothetical protein [Bradyrhizobium archetypum]|uniref:Uncharacterized protein n=1 Tax=Bradyrhizobium archetypum TaxID=2721160 RepID=A0A7Y4H527_9BRAD|nr:hypothetical protein [Bradyrhizobium archetypum]NOJ47823.1 hypothetical protein [Bradyrhizobium archetypum]
MSKPVSVRSHERIEIARLEEKYRTFRTLIKVSGAVFGVYIAREAIETLAGQTTKLAFELAVLANVQFAFTLTLAGVATAWAVVERITRQRKVEQMQGRIRDLETRLDPNRSSSGLTPKGKTNPKDKPK